ncbi:MAG: hypothetical protein ACM3TT_06675 [Syntrophothermus sp.]
MADIAQYSFPVLLYGGIALASFAAARPDCALYMHMGRRQKICPGFTLKKLKCAIARASKKVTMQYEID